MFLARIYHIKNSSLNFNMSEHQTITQSPAYFRLVDLPPCRVDDWFNNSAWIRRWAGCVRICFEILIKAGGMQSVNSP